MKNIHILPTDKPSRLFLKENALLLNNQYTLQEIFSKGKCQNIYITSDEKPKSGDWCMSLCDDESYGEIYQCKDVKLVDEDDKKIILTTDQDLIKDGVQAIDDEFLEWFVKNPNCEEVEVKDSSIVKEHIWDGSNDGEIIWEKEIIIPKEEYKLELDCPYDFTSRCTMGRCDCKSKQETLEEAFGNYIKERYHLPIRDSEPDFESAKFGAKWQQKRMYSEEELLEFGELVLDTFHSEGRTKSGKDRLARIKFKGWFEQFKKK